MTEDEIEMMVVWVYRGQGKGAMQTVTPEVGRRMINDGRAQDCKTTPSIDLKPVERDDPLERSQEYATRELNARVKRGRSTS